MLFVNIKQALMINPFFYIFVIYEPMVLDASNMPYTNLEQLSLETKNDPAQSDQCIAYFQY